MKAVIPKNIEQLAEKNAEFLEKINFTPGEDDPRDLCNAEAYKKTELFDDHIVDSIFGDSDNVADEQTQQVPLSLGMVLVRPDMVHVSNQVESLLFNRFEPVHTEDVVVDVGVYWNIYKHDLYRTETMHTRLTRAAMYIGSECRLIVFKDDTMAVADVTYNQLKGAQGHYQSGTIRGDVVYKESLRLGLDKLGERDVDPCIATATDMFGAYRLISNQPVGPHRVLARPLLFYTGVGVHVPSGSEIHTDLPQFGKFD